MEQLETEREKRRALVSGVVEEGEPS